MADIERRIYCGECERNTLHAKSFLVSNGIGCLLAVLTAGLFIPVWIGLSMLEYFRPLRCQRCGSGSINWIGLFVVLPATLLLFAIFGWVLYIAAGAFGGAFSRNFR